MACRHPAKKPYTEAEARRALKNAKAFSKENKKLRNRLHVYQCPGTDHWHLGHDKHKRTTLADQIRDIPALV